VEMRNKRNVCLVWFSLFSSISFWLRGEIIWWRRAFTPVEKRGGNCGFEMGL
jgi:hypothetical protein